MAGLAPRDDGHVQFSATDGTGIAEFLGWWQNHAMMVSAADLTLI